MKKLISVLFITIFFLAGININCQSNTSENAGLILPDGFTANKLIENIGRARHIAVTPQGNIYVRLSRPKDGAGTLYLVQNNNKATVKLGFDNTGGTGIYLKDGFLYTSSNEEIFRHKLDNNNEIIDKDKPETIVTGLINRGQHESKSLVLDNEGNIYVNIGAYSNACQEQDRQRGSLGIPDCPILDSAGGIWKFKADKPKQTYGDGIRYATGLRNVVGLDWNPEVNQLFVMQHGRDQLHDNFPDLYTTEQSAELPAECMYALKQGDDCGWPYIYYDGIKKKKMLAPEYGGDGKKEANGKYIDPVASYPAHIGPNGLLFYTGDMFPDKYKNGAFIAFHGSWNRAPEPQEGFYVVFQPFKDGKPSGDWEIFADNFAGSKEKTASGRADNRPCGLAQGPDGSLYVSDDSKGAIYKISYTKN